MIDIVIFSSDAFMPRTQVCIESINKYIPDSKIHLVKVKDTEKYYVEDLAKNRLLKAKELIEAGCKEVMVLGADCVFYNTPDIFLNTGGNIVLIPHVITPPIENAAYMYQTGHCNADLILFRPGCLPLLNWVLSQEMKNDIKNGYFYDQLLLSSLPFFEGYVGICKDPGINFAFYNFWERKFSKKDDVYYVNDNKLCMVQYSGFIKGHPDKISRHFSKKVDNELILELFQEYDRKIQ